MADALLVLRWLLGIVFLAAAVAKSRQTFAAQTEVVADYRILPIFFSKPVAVLLVPTEGLVGLFLLAGVWVQQTAALAAVMFVAFSLAVAINLFRGRREVGCGCFGSSSSRISWWLVARNLGLAIVGVAVASIHARGWARKDLDSANLVADATLALLVCALVLLFMSGVQLLHAPNYRR